MVKIMKKLNFKMLIVLFASFFSIGAVAANDSAMGVIIDGKNIAITSVSTTPLISNKVVSNLDFPDGIFINVSHVFGGPRYLNAEALVRERFSSQGIKVVDKMEGASAMMMVMIPGGSFNLADADKKAAYSSLPNTDQVLINSGAVAGALMTGGPAVLIGLAVGSLFPVDSKATISTMIFMKPVMEKGMFFGENIRSSLKDGEFSNGIYISYKLEKGKEATDDIALKMVTDQWIKKFVLFDAQPSTPVAAAAPVAVAAGEEAKK